MVESPQQALSLLLSGFTMQGMHVHSLHLPGTWAAMGFHVPC